MNSQYNRENGMSNNRPQSSNKPNSPYINDISFTHSKLHRDAREAENMSYNEYDSYDASDRYDTSDEYDADIITFERRANTGRNIDRNSDITRSADARHAQMVNEQGKRGNRGSYAKGYAQGRNSSRHGQTENAMSRGQMGYSNDYEQTDHANGYGQTNYANSHRQTDYINSYGQAGYANSYEQTGYANGYGQADYINNTGSSMLHYPMPKKRFTLKKLMRIWRGKDRTELFFEEDIEANRFFSAAAASGLLFFVPLTASPYSKYGRYWANQGVIMLVIMLMSGIVSLAVGGILSLFGAIPYIGIVFRIIKLVFLIALWLMNLALIIRGCYYAAKGRAKDFPLIGYMKIIGYK